MSADKAVKDTTEPNHHLSKPLHPELVWREETTGRKPGDRKVRYARHHAFRDAGPGVLVARPEATEPKERVGKLLWQAKHLLIGQPIPSTSEIHERLTKLKALAVLSSDALSSVAYGTEAIMRTLLLGGVAALSLTLPISLVITALLAIVATSYQQTIKAYPKGGGSYIVARENLGTLPGLTAGASLLIDYVLTVAVSIAAGVDALRSAFPIFSGFELELAVLAVALIGLLNLRGIKDSGTIFAAPTYIFIASILGMIALGLWQYFNGAISYEPGPAGDLTGTETLGWFLILAAFSRGCAAMTGTEAISDGVPAFKPPESKNARLTLMWMAILLGTMFVGISFLVSQIGLIPVPDEKETVLSQLTRLIVGDSWYYYLVQFATMLILFLAANTAYADFPRLLSFLARDQYAPSWFGIRGDRLAFSIGIMVLTAFSVLLLIIFGSDVQRLLPLYAVGVFTSFTLSQAGMVVRWLRLREPGFRRSALINGTGALMTAVVALVIGYTKFMEGAWIVILLAGVMIGGFLSINAHYKAVRRQLYADGPIKPREAPPLAVVPIFNLSLVAREALSLAGALSKKVVAVHVTTDRREADSLREQWQSVVGDVPLVIIESPYRWLLPPLLAYIDALREMDPDSSLLVVLPEFVPRHWWEHLLHNRTAVRLKNALHERQGIVVANVPYHLAE